MATIVFATTTQQADTDTLDAAGVEYRLLSYWYLRALSPNFLHQYVEREPTIERKQRVQIKE